jgi:cellulase
MKSAIAFALAAAELAYGHATFQSFVIDGKDAGQHKGVQTPSNANNPILDVTSKSMICNGGTEAADFVEVAAGSKIQLQWHHNDGAGDASGDKDEPIASSHHGPIMVYMAPAESKGEGEVWVKIQEDGLTGTTWAVDTFYQNKGLIDVTVPNLAPGNYYIRPEIIALHEASAEAKAQFYNGCGQIKVTGSGSASLPSGVDMTKVYSAQDPGVLCNIYGDVKCTASGSAGYDIPGPAVWDGASGSAPAPGAGSGSGNETAPAPAPTATTPATPEQPSATQPAAEPTASAEAGTGSGSDSDLPETFTITEFISWLEKKTGSATAKRFARAFARRAHARAFA